MVGRALRPVEAIRSEVSEIGATDLHRRVPQPATGDEIGRLAVTMNAMLDRIESGAVRQQRFVSDASHELRTPLAISRHMLETALRDPESTDWSTIAGDVLDEELRMQRLVDDLLWLARHDQHPHFLQHALLDLDEVVMRQAVRTPGRVGVELDLSAVSAGQVRGSEDDLTRVVQNLLDNALRHATSRVAVSLHSEPCGRVVLAVDDDGPGVPPEMRDMVFERFSRADTARGRDDGGSGLGLAIAQEIIADHDGVLAVGASGMGGARFSVEIHDARAD
ncbi:MAG: HAMP domain-containing sensor histidine kinase [Acidimicrobiales bacterium]